MKKLSGILSLTLAAAMLFALLLGASAVYAEDEAAEGTSYEEIQVGDTIFFGSYEQDREEGADPIEWLVVEKDGDNLFLVSVYALDCKPYNEHYETVGWEDCTLRAWLNGEFYETAFNAEEQAKVLETTVPAAVNIYSAIDAGNDTLDRVFILGIEELRAFFPTEDSAVCRATPYAQSQGAFVASNSTRCWYWLRSPGCYDTYATFIRCYGRISWGGAGVHQAHYGIRPAIRIEG